MHEEIDRFVNVERGTVIQLFDEGKGRAQIYVSGVPWFRKLRVLSKARAEFRRLTAPETTDFERSTKSPVRFRPAE